MKLWNIISKVTQEDAMLDGFIQSGLGRAYLEKKENPSALPHLLKAEKIALHSNHLELKIEVFKTLSHYYKSEGEYDKFSDYHDKYIESFELSEKKKKQTIDSFVHTIQEEEKRLTGKQNILVIVSVSLTLFVIILFIWHRRSKKRTIERFNAVMRNMKVQTSETLSPKPETSPEITQTKDKKPLISAAVETKILAGLLEFEKTEKFTDKQISLPILAGILNTNTKYLSYILRTHKNKDFNTYINELRVKYIIEKLEKYETFQNYKISYLAEEAGFSSHSKFSAVFKSVTGFPPSTFLNLLKTRN